MNRRGRRALSELDQGDALHQSLLDLGVEGYFPYASGIVLFGYGLAPHSWGTVTENAPSLVQYCQL